MMIDSMAVLDIFILALKRRRTTTKNTGTKKIASTVRSPSRPLHRYLLRSARRNQTSTDNQRHNAEDKRQRGHQDGRKRIRTASSVASIRPLPSYPSSLWRIRR